MGRSSNISQKSSSSIISAQNFANRVVTFVDEFKIKLATNKDFTINDI